MKHYLGSGVFGQVARASLDELDKCEKMQAGVDEVWTANSRRAV